jgi:hypothetical protein
MSITEIEAHEAAQEVTNAAVDAEARKLFKYSAFIDSGAGADTCEHARDGACKDTEHFHAWCRLPNPLQHKDIRDKGLAAKARKVRALRDPESDASAVMDAELGALDDEAFRSALVDELVQRDWTDDYMEAQDEVEGGAEYEHLAQDREEYARLSPIESDLSEEQQSEEFKQLRWHMTAYLEAVRMRLVEIQTPKREEFAQRSLEALIATLRAQRIEEEASRAFIDTYNVWMWYVGTYKVEKHPTLGRPFNPMWQDIGRSDRASAGTMLGESPEVIDALKVVYNDLSVGLSRGSAGNS